MNGVHMKKYDELSVRERIGQRLVVGFLETELTEEFRSFLKEYKIGNIILFSRNAQNRQQLKRLCEDIQEEVLKNTGLPAFICIDQEGGNTTRLPKDCLNIEGAAALASRKNPRLIYEAGRATGGELRSVGVNFNLAPVLDVNSNPENPIIGDRSYSSDPKEAGIYAMEMAKGLMDEGILCCGKHFPGHGDTSTDSHLTLPMVPKNREELEKTELVPFRYAIEKGIPAIMTTHILFPQINKETEGDIPATMSKQIVSGLLREELGFRGLVLSDCLEMKAIAKFYGISKGCLEAMKAGVDMVLISHTREYAEKAYITVEEAYNSGKLDEENMKQSLERILRAKEQL